MNIPEIAKCPCCGEEAYSGSHGCIMCGSCGLHAESIETWNRRVKIESWVNPWTGVTITESRQPTPTIDTLQGASAEVYQCVGALLYETGRFESDQGIMLLDLLSWMSGNRDVRPDTEKLLPFPSSEPTPEAADAWIKHGGIPACTTDPLVKMAWESDGYKVIPVYAHPPKPEPTEADCLCPQHGRWLAADDIYRMVRELDVAMNGLNGAANKQASLCDIFQELKDYIEAAKADVVIAPKPPAEWMDAAAKEIDQRYYRSMVNKIANPETTKLITLAELRAIIAKHYSAPAGKESDK